MTHSNSPVPAVSAEVKAWLEAKRSDAAYKQQAIEILRQMVQIDSTPKPSIEACAQADSAVFDIIEAHLNACTPDIELERLPIRDEIADHIYFTSPYYAFKPGDSRHDTTRRAYRNRTNLVARMPQPGGKILAGNAHIDTVAPHFPPRVEGDKVFGRGSLDDKGNALVMMLATQLLTEIAETFDVKPACELLWEFVIDEETGGNGSLSLALEKEKCDFDTIVVLEATGLTARSANRGVVWYTSELAGVDVPAGPRDSLLEASAFVVKAFGECGDKLKAESEHPQFPHKPVQTCHGCVGQYGDHPSRVNDYAPLQLAWQGDMKAEIEALVDEAIKEYCARYGDKTQPGVGEAVIEKHLAWSPTDDGAVLEVFGLAGHMGSVDRLDGAITKAAWIIRKLVAARQERGGDWDSLVVTLKDRQDSPSLLLEGGQGFLPTHTVEQVSDRMIKAAAAGVAEYLQLVGLPEGAITNVTKFEKLHNDAFARPVDGPAMTLILDACRQVDLYHGEEVRGWDVSCDARIFAREFPESEIITFGPGELAQAHSNTEHLDMNEVIKATEVLVLMALSYGR